VILQRDLGILCILRVGVAACYKKDSCVDCDGCCRYVVFNVFWYGSMSNVYFVYCVVVSHLVIGNLCLL